MNTPNFAAEIAAAILMKPRGCVRMNPRAIKIDTEMISLGNTAGLGWELHKSPEGWALGTLSPARQGHRTGRDTRYAGLA
jgi:hypothetical protein